ncbi:nSTAND1 domain-containing NTPase [Sorangium sp. So ce1099]|uniref:nSTAND1 domain-containing NTPase n=1 Tax=Sorangium sp. So ce1099 TaxID=3133331 RepID=UPI003F5F742D
MSSPDEARPRPEGLLRKELRAPEGVEKEAGTSERASAAAEPAHAHGEPHDEGAGVGTVYTGSTTGDFRPQAPVVHAGTRIEHHEIIRLLGRGGMGQVYLARDVRLGRLVALKFVTETSPSRAERFIAEARTTAQLTHENIVGLYDIGEHEGSLYMVLEYVKGQTLKEWLEERASRVHDPPLDAPRPGPALPPSRAAELMAPVVRALVHAHDAGLVHRDLKPSNIMLTESGTVKVLDFGIAKLVQDAEERAGAPAKEAATATLPVAGASITRTGAQVGTLPYMSPEQWGAAEVDHRTDLWAVGVMLCELVTGRHPLAPLSDEALATVADLAIPMPSVREARSDLGKLGTLIDRCLLKRKEDRIGSARLLLAELESIPRAELFIDVEAQSPYAGLASFQERDAHRFFGRERAVARVVARLSEQPLIAIVGASGAGKSSFVRAGVIPALKRGGDAWEAFIVRPGPRPLTALAELLVQHSWTQSSQSSDTSHETTSRVPREDEDAPREAKDVKDVKDTAPAGRSERDAVCERLRSEPGFLGAEMRVRARRRLERIVFFIDQFEELYTLAPAEERAAFLACLAGAADDIDSPLRVMLSLRSDFLDRMADAPPSIVDMMSRGTVLIRPMDREELRSALVKPAEAAEHRFESAALVEEMLDALAHTAGALPLLQFTAARMWVMRDVERRVLTEASYRAIGGVAGALASHADAVLGGMGPAERRWARAVLLRLVTPERTRAIATVGELRELSGPAAAADLARVVGRLIEARLLTVEGSDQDESTVELVHESLVAHWPTLTRWLDEDAEDSAFLARLRSAAREWRASGEREGLLWTGDAAEEAQRFAARHRGELTLAEGRFLQAVIALVRRDRRRRKQILTAVIAGLSLVALSFSYLAVRAGREAARAEEQAALAKQQAARADQEAALARAQKQETERGAARARNASRIAAARERQPDPTTVLALVREIEPGPAPRGWSALARGALDAGVASSLLAHDHWVSSAEFSADGRHIVTACWDNHVRVWNADGSGQPLVLRGHDGIVSSASFSPDGRRIASASLDMTVRVWNADGSGQPIILRGHEGPALSPRFSPDGRRVVTAGVDMTVRVWNADGSGQPLVLRGHDASVVAAAFSPDGRRIASAAWDRTVRVWNADGSGQPLVLRGHGGPLRSLRWSPDGRRIVSASDDRTVRVWNADGSGQPIILRGHDDTVHSAAFSSDGRLVVSASADKTARVWSADGSGQARVLRGHEAGLFSAAFSPDDQHIISASWDNTARVWKARDAGHLLLLGGHTGLVHSAAFSPDGRRIASASSDKTVRVWNADGAGQPIVLRGHTESVLSAAWSPDGRHLASASVDGTVRVWSADGAGEPLVLRADEQTISLGSAFTVTSAAFSPDGRRIASSSFDGTVRVWNADGSGEPLVLRGNGVAVYSAVWSPDGRHIVTASWDKAVRVWNADGSGEPRVLRGHDEAVTWAAWSADGRRIVSASADKTVRVWNADGSGEPLVLRGHEAAVSVSGGRPFSPDGRRIVSSSADLTVRVWNADGTGEPLVLRGSSSKFNSAAFSPDGAQIVAASDDNAVWLWRGDLDPLRDPDDPRLWSATTYCPSVEARMRLLDVPAEVARDDLARCEERVRKAQAESAPR